MVPDVSKESTAFILKGNVDQSLRSLRRMVIFSFRNGGEISPEDRALYPRRKLVGCYVPKIATFI
jgi:hypothetical protein